MRVRPFCIPQSPQETHSAPSLPEPLRLSSLQRDDWGLPLSIPRPRAARPHNPQPRAEKAERSGADRLSQPTSAYEAALEVYALRHAMRRPPPSEARQRRDLLERQREVRARYNAWGRPPTRADSASTGEAAMKRRLFATDAPNEARRPPETRRRAVFLAQVAKAADIAAMERDSVRDAPHAVARAEQHHAATQTGAPTPRMERPSPRNAHLDTPRPMTRPLGEHTPIRPATPVGGSDAWPRPIYGRTRGEGVDGCTATRGGKGHADAFVFIRPQQNPRPLPRHVDAARLGDWEDMWRLREPKCSPIASAQHNGPVFSRLVPLYVLDGFAHARRLRTAWRRWCVRCRAKRLFPPHQPREEVEKTNEAEERMGNPLRDLFAPHRAREPRGLAEGLAWRGVCRRLAEPLPLRQHAMDGDRAWSGRGRSFSSEIAMRCAETPSSASPREDPWVLLDA